MSLRTISAMVGIFAVLALNSGLSQAQTDGKEQNSVVLQSKIDVLKSDLSQIKRRLLEIEKRDKRYQAQTNTIDLRSDVNSKEIKANAKEIKNVTQRVDETAKSSTDNRENIRTNDVVLQLHGNALNTYKDSLNEVVNKLDQQATGASLQSKQIKRIRDSAGLDKTHLNRFWMLLAALLVFFMQAGFKVYEVGLVRMKDRNSVGIKNLLDWVVVSLVFYWAGFGLMFGESVSGIFGFSFFAAAGIEESANELGYEFFLFQIAFAATAATIVSGALAVRTMLFSYMILALFIGLIIYPLFGHWAWGHLFLPDNKPWLASLGFLDFAGGTVVHSVGAWIALVGAYCIRPRIGKTIDRETGLIKIHKPDNFRPYDLSYSVLGILILWVGWWGFNGGSSVFVTIDDDNFYSNLRAPSIILNTSLAGSAGALVAFLHSYFVQQRKHIYEKMMGGTLAGLVAITPCANVVSAGIAVSVVGAGAGLLHNFVYDWLNEKPLFNRIIDDPIGAIAVHGPPGMYGTLCVTLGDPELIKGALGPFYTEDWSRLSQFGIQLFGVLVCSIYTIGVSLAVFRVLQNSIGLEVSVHHEAEGDILGLRGDEKKMNLGL